MPKNKSELLALTAKIENLFDLLDEDLSQQPQVLREAKSMVTSILKDDFLINDEEMSKNGLSKITKDSFEKFCIEEKGVSNEVVKQLFDLLKKAIRIKKQLEKIVLSDAAINERLQQKFCKVTTLYGEGTGYIIDDKKGIILSSFHLVSAIKPLQITAFKELSDIDINSVLYAANYIDSEFRITKRGLQIVSKEDLIQGVKKAEVKDKIIINVNLEPTEIKRLIYWNKYKAFILNNYQEAINNPTKRFQFDLNEASEVKLAMALYLTGYLDSKFCVTKDFIKVDDSLIPIAQGFHVLTGKFESKEVDAIKHNLINNVNGVTDKIFNFIERAKHEKEVVLLTEDVEIQCDSETLKGKIILPEETKGEGGKQKILKNLAYFDVLPIQITRFGNDVPFEDGTRIIYTGEAIQSFPEGENLMVGEKVYFGGYPLTQQEYTFSTGIISSITSSTNRTCYVLEAQVSPGNSGSPVFIQSNGEIFWIGVINSEVAHVSEEMLETREKLARMSETIKTGNLGFIESFRAITTTLLANLTTGKGKAFSIPSIDCLLDETFVDHEHFVIDPFLDFLVPKKLPNKVREEAKNEIDARKAQQYDVFEWNGQTFYLSPDNHKNKHVKGTIAISEKWSKSRKEVEDTWHQNNTPATFNEKYAKNYIQILKDVIKAVVSSFEICGLLHMLSQPTKDIVGTLPNSYGAAYIRYKNQLFYVNGMQQKCEEIKLSDREMNKFDTAMRPTNEIRTLLMAELGDITSITRHVHAIKMHVRMTEPVGWDRGKDKKGEETRIIELYSQDTGSHMRPKAASWLKDEDVIDFSTYEKNMREKSKKAEQQKDYFQVKSGKNGRFFQEQDYDAGARVDSFSNGTVSSLSSDNLDFKEPAP